MTKDIESWVRSVRATLAQMASQGIGYPMDVNEVSESSSELPPGVPPALEPMYAVFDGLSLPDVHNGYFIDQADRLVTATQRGGPTRLEGEPPRRIHVFGSDGGGSLFALDLDDETIYYLPSSGVYKDGVFLADKLEPVCVVAGNVMEFLDRLKADIEAFVRGEQKYPYMAR